MARSSSSTTAVFPSRRRRSLQFALLVVLLLDRSGSSSAWGRKKNNDEQKQQEEARQEECDVSADGTTTCASSSSSSTSSSYDPLDECTVYMAPSTLGETTNMGIYAGKSMKKGQVVNFPEIAIPLTFRVYPQHPEPYFDGAVWERYIWEGPTTDIETYDDTDRYASKATFVPGVGCTVNSIMNMNNIISTHGSIYDTAGLHRSKDPGSGAFSPYHSSKTVVDVPQIPEGAELFAAYGEEWIPNFDGAQITTDAVMDRAEEFLRDVYHPFVREKQQQQEEGGKMSPELAQALWEFTARDFPVYSQMTTVLPSSQPWSVVQRALEEEEEKNIIGEEEEEKKKRSVIRSFIRKQSIRSPEWLKERGYCQDHIRPGLSTVDQAGRGAFAVRDLPEGTVVGYSPLIHVGEDGRKVLRARDNQGQEAPDGRLDLVINYSFGHPNSTVLLTPYGGMVNYINHGNESRANVKVRFPDKELVAHKPDWLGRTPRFLRENFDRIALSFEYVALRDIRKDEEVLMDYGEDWQRAWNEHVQNWQPPAGDAENYVHSTQWEEKTIRTTAELETNPYPPNLVTMCIESYTKDDELGDFVYIPPARETTKRVYCNVLERYDAPEDYQDDEKDDDDGTLYKVEMMVKPKGPRRKQQQPEFISVVVDNVEPDAIFLYDRAFSNDWHLPNAFRHEIGIPDDVIPQSWLNGRPADDEEKESSGITGGGDNRNSGGDNNYGGFDYDAFLRENAGNL